MGSEPRLTQQTIDVLGALLAMAEMSGSQIAKQTGLASGTLYPILYRLEDAGWVASRWEEGDPVLLRRPRRRFYRITAMGQRNVARVVAELTPVNGSIVWES
jgi:DNA-binding PadR family transcriptional regulator